MRAAFSAASERCRAVRGDGVRAVRRDGARRAAALVRRLVGVREAARTGRGRRRVVVRFAEAAEVCPVLRRGRALALLRFAVDLAAPLRALLERPTKMTGSPAPIRALRTVSRT